MDNEILGHLQGTGEASLREIQEAVDADIGTVFARCRELERDHQINRVRPFTYECPDPQTPDFASQITVENTNDTETTGYSNQSMVTPEPSDQEVTDTDTDAGFIWGEDR